MRKVNSKILLIAGIVVVAVGGYFTLQAGLLGGGANPLPGTNSQDIVKSALTGSGSIKCEYTDTDTSSEVISYVKDGKIRADVVGATPQESGSMIFKDETMWSWNDETGEGFTFDISPDEKDTDIDTSMYDEWKEVEGGIKEYREHCSQENVSDSMFEVPNDIEFLDASDMFDPSMYEDAMEGMENISQ